MQNQALDCGATICWAGVKGIIMEIDGLHWV